MASCLMGQREISSARSCWFCRQPHSCRVSMTNSFMPLRQCFYAVLGDTAVLSKGNFETLFTQRPYISWPSLRSIFIPYKNCVRSYPGACSRCAFLTKMVRFPYTLCAFLTVGCAFLTVGCAFLTVACAFLTVWRTFLTMRFPYSALFLTCPGLIWNGLERVP